MKRPAAIRVCLAAMLSIALAHGACLAQPASDRLRVDAPVLSDSFDDASRAPPSELSDRRPSDGVVLAAAALSAVAAAALIAALRIDGRRLRTRRARASARRRQLDARRAAWARLAPATATRLPTAGTSAPGGSSARSRSREVVDAPGDDSVGPRATPVAAFLEALDRLEARHAPVERALLSAPTARAAMAPADGPPSAAAVMDDADNRVPAAALERRIRGMAQWSSERQPRR